MKNLVTKVLSARLKKSKLLFLFSYVHVAASAIRYIEN